MLGVTGGLYDNQSNYSFNAMPDIIVKAAFEPGFGHYEVFGIFSRFRDRVYPCVEYVCHLEPVHWRHSPCHAEPITTRRMAVDWERMPASPLPSTWTSGFTPFSGTV